jgi:hypothetical protein
VAIPWDQIDGNKIKGVGEFGIGFGAEIVEKFVQNTQSAAFGRIAAGAGGIIAGPFSTGVV